MEEVDKILRRALSDKEAFWSEVADRLRWTKRWTKVYDGTDSPFDKWFVGGELNLCDNCVDRHVEEGHGQRTAFMFYSLLTGIRREYTFDEVLDQVSRLAGVLRAQGVQKGDVVLVYQPMTPEGAFSVLGCARIGAIHACLPNGLPAKDLALRIDHCRPKVILASSHGYHPSGWINYKTQIDLACASATHKPNKIIILQREHLEAVPMTPGRDLDWNEELKTAQKVPCVPMETNQPSLMVYTSGSTGDPKAVVHAVGRYVVRMEADIPLVFGRSQDDEVIFMTTNLGWIAAQTLVIYGPLLKMLNTVLFEGDPLLTEDVNVLYKLLQDCRVTRPIIRPGILKILKAKDPTGAVAKQYNFQRLKLMFTGGERTDLDTMTWAARIFGVNSFNGYGQTESSALIAGIPDTSIPKSSHLSVDYTRTTPGWDVVIMRPDNTPAKPNEVGRVLIRLPLPPGALLAIFQRPDLYKSNYFTEYPGYFDTKDEGILDDQGKLKCECRTDDIMKVGQIYLSAQAVEEVVSVHPALAQFVVVSFPDLIWKELPVLLYTKREDCLKSPSEVSKELEELVHRGMGSSVKLGGAVQVRELPRGRTGKIHRPSCNLIIRGRPVFGVGAVENPETFESISQAVKEAGFGRDVLLD